MDYSINISGDSIPGTRYNGLNQDTYIIKMINRINFVIGVFDGHGPYGERASEIAKNIVDDEFSNNWSSIVHNLEKDPRSFFEGLSRKIHDHIVESYKNIPKSFKYNINGRDLKLKLFQDKSNNYYWAYKGSKISADFGTTMSLIVFTNLRCYFTNIGDSQSFIYSVENGQESVKSPLSLHNTTNMNEIDRIKSIFPSAVFRNGYFIEPTYPQNYSCNCCNQSQICVTRSLGHKYMSQFGISYTPDCYVECLEKPSYLILGSDGVWDSFNGFEFDPWERSPNENVGLLLSNQYQDDNATCIACRIS